MAVLVPITNVLGEVNFSGEAGLERQDDRFPSGRSVAINTVALVRRRFVSSAPPRRNPIRMLTLLHILVINRFGSLLSKMEQGVLRQEEPPVRVLRNEGVPVKIIKFGRTVTRRELDS